MIHARVYTDGSCIYHYAEARSGERLGCGAVGWGGWAAVIERGSEGWVLRGREPETTSTRMELVAIIEALRALPGVTPITVYTDATVAWSVEFRREQGGREALAGVRDGDLWLALADELDRRPVRFKLVRRRDSDEHGTIHRRCHNIANAEARALARESYVRRAS